MPLPGWIGWVLRAATVAVGVVFATVAGFEAVVVPYRFWDSLAFGSWSRSIAEHGALWSGQPPAYLQRPLFYLEQGLAWRALGYHEWLGRLLSLSFVVLLAVALWVLAGRLTEDRNGRALLPPLAVGLVLASSVLATYAAAGMSDVPVAALVAATAAALWRDRPGPLGLALVAVLATAAVLAKPTALIAFAGLVPAAFVVFGSRAGRSVLGLVAGVALALGYSAWQSGRLHMSVLSFVTAGNGPFWRERGAAARWDALARAEWLGGGLRLLVLFGLSYAVARALGGRTRVALAIAGATAIAWSIVGPPIADGKVGYPFGGSIVGLIAWLALAAAFLIAPFLAVEDPVGRRTHAALVIWSAPVCLSWAWQRADEVRLLAPAWAPLVLMTAAALGTVSLALARLRPVAALAPAAAVGLLVLANLVSIDGLGRDAWRDLLRLGPSGWTNQAAIENLAYGPFSYELDLARENVGAGEQIVSSDGRLEYFFPGRVDVEYARSCADLAKARFFSYLGSDESAAFAQSQGQSLDPLGWLQCTTPRVRLVGEQEGIYTAFVIGGPPARAPDASDCHITWTPGQRLDAVFGDRLTYAEAASLAERARSVGFVAARLEQTSCSLFRVVVTGVPDKASVRSDIRSEAASVGLRVVFAAPVRYPEVSTNVVAVR